MSGLMKKLLTILLGSVLLATPVLADSTINGLGAGAAVQSTDIFPAYQGANPATGVTAAQIKTFVAVPIGANPSATAGPAAINGVATTFMRSDGAPAIQLGTAAQKGIVQVDGTTITVAAGIISAVQPAGANPSATAGPAAVTGVATTFMRSDGAPAIQLGTAAQKGLLQGDGATLTITSGVIAINLTNANTWSGVQTFNSSALKVNGSGSGVLTINCAATCGTSTVTFPGASDTVAELGQANAFTGNNTHTGTEDFSGTTTPTMAAGHVIVGGIMTAPTFAANGEGAFYLSSTLGLVLQGQGSTDDVIIINKSGSTVCAVATGAIALVCSGKIQTSATGPGFQNSANTNALADSLFQNSNSGASAQYQIQIGNNTSATEATLTINSSGNSGGNGANSFTINGAAGVWLQGGGTNGMEVDSAGGVRLLSAAPTVGASQVGLGTGTSAQASCGGPTVGAAGCLVINVAGTTRNIPFF
jgi:hypothetical protein